MEAWRGCTNCPVGGGQGSTLSLESLLWFQKEGFVTLPPPVCLWGKPAETPPASVVDLCATMS